MIIFVLLKIGITCAWSYRQSYRGADDAKVGEFPYLVNIVFKNNSVGGGSILNHRTILTAARCVHKRPHDFIKISIPGLNTMDNTSIYHDVELYRIHPNYRFPLADVATIKLAVGIIFTVNIKPVVLEIASVKESVVCTLVGEAYDKYPGGTRLKKLQKVVLLTKECVCELHNLPITDRNICTYANSENVDGHEVCITDSGYPLIMKGKLVGMLSFGASCSPSFPNVFVRTTCYRTWIGENTYE